MDPAFSLVSGFTLTDSGGNKAKICSGMKGLVEVAKVVTRPQMGHLSGVGGFEDGVL